MPAFIRIADSAPIHPPRGLRHHVAEALRIQAGAAQYRRHDVVGQQFVEARLIAAAIKASVHDPLLTYIIVGRFAANHVLFVTSGRVFRGNLYMSPTIFPSKWK